jgi:hypothetical protein
MCSLAYGLYSRSSFFSFLALHIPSCSFHSPLQVASHELGYSSLLYKPAELQTHSDRSLEFRSGNRCSPLFLSTCVHSPLLSPHSGPSAPSRVQSHYFTCPDISTSPSSPHSPGPPRVFAPVHPTGASQPFLAHHHPPRPSRCFRSAPASLPPHQRPSLSHPRVPHIFPLLVALQSLIPDFHTSSPI